MAAERPYVKTVISRKAEKSVRQGHPWVYADEVRSVSGEYENGEIVDVFSEKDRYLGSGFINDNSKIRIRILSTNANDRFDEAFWLRRLRYAIDYRKTVMGDQFSNCRLIFGEADGFPGLTVDRFGGVLVAQTLSLGIEKIKDMLFPALLNMLSADGEEMEGLFQRNDVAIRDREGMEQYKMQYFCPGFEKELSGVTEICENGLYYRIDYKDGQKTGYFLDQKFNRLAISRIAKGKRVLDCFTNNGSFGMNAVLGGALSVTSVDISADAVEASRRNAERNGLADNIEFVKADVFDLLTKMADEGKKGEYDLIILDPPAFTKSRATIKNAYRGYKEINLKAMKLLPRGGYLATCSCSHFMSDEMFRQMLQEAALDAKVSLRRIEARQQGPDHPVLSGVPETEYLKFYIFQVV